MLKLLADESPTICLHEAPTDLVCSPMNSPLAADCMRRLSCLVKTVGCLAVLALPVSAQMPAINYGSAKLSTSTAQRGQTVSATVINAPKTAITASIAIGGRSFPDLPISAGS